VEDTENQCLSWLPVLKLNLALTNSNGQTLRRPGMQEEPRTIPVCLAKRAGGRPEGLIMELGTKYAVINYQVCEPDKCDPHQGICKAVQVCPHDLLIQEEPGDPPMLYSTRMCVGCGDCVRACSLNVINIQYG